MLINKNNIESIKTITLRPLVKYKVLNLKQRVIFTLNPKLVSSKRTNKCFIFVKKAKHIDFLTETSDELFNRFEYNFPLGFFAGCINFSFRITFKEYKIGLKAAKFSLLLNQFKLNINLFIELITEVLTNNFPLEFFEDFVGYNLTE